MSFRLNTVTNKWEQTSAGANGNPPLTPEQKKDGDLRQTASQFGLSPEQVLYGADRQSVAARKAYNTKTATSSTPYGTAQGSSGEMSLAEPQKTGREWIGRDPSADAALEEQIPLTGQDAIDSMWQAVYDEAAVYRQTFGEEPPSSWWTARTTQIENQQKRFDTAAKAQAGASSAAATAAAKAKKEEQERVRKVKGGRQGEAFLREQAVTRKAEMLKRVAELYDPMETKSKEDLAVVLQNASDAFDLAEQQVGEAQTKFEEQFKPSTAYQGAPVSTFNVANNPLLAALQSQGAGTAEVGAATDYARQTAAQTSALEKWANEQLNVGQQNYGSAVQNAAQMGTMAALQQLGGRRAEVKSGIDQQFADALAKIAAERTSSESDVDEKIADIISKADEMAAKTTADYGNLPKDEIDKKLPNVPKPKKPAASTPAAPTTPKPAVVTPVVPPPAATTTKKKTSTAPIRLR
jgi:hypothetical protein